MPNYDYRCKNCGYESTVFQKISDTVLTQCSECLENTLQRLITGKDATLRFEGSGYYVTDYAKECDGCCESCKK